MLGCTLGVVPQVFVVPFQLAFRDIGPYNGYIHTQIYIYIYICTHIHILSYISVPLKGVHLMDTTQDPMIEGASGFPTILCKYQGGYTGIIMSLSGSISISVYIYIYIYLYISVVCVYIYNK